MSGTRRFVVVSGLPGSGKSTVGREIAQLLGCQMLDKDDFLERRFDDQTHGDTVDRSTLSREADAEFRRSAEASSGAVLVSFWRRDAISTTSGTPTLWLFDLPNVVEVHCRCTTATAVDRFCARQRHLGHGDGTRTRAALTQQFEALANAGPLGVGELVVVDTEPSVDAGVVVASVQSAWPDTGGCTALCRS